MRPGAHVLSCRRVARRAAAVAVVAAVWATSVAWTARAGQSAQPIPAQAAGPVRDGESTEPPEAFRRVCIKCHTSDRVVQGRRFRAQWDELIEQMVARGAVVNDDDYDVIIAYLMADFGRVNVNTASAADLAEVLHLEPAEADAIVTARTQAGKFADFESLVGAPGVPVDALTKRRDALFF